MGLGVLNLEGIVVQGCPRLDLGADSVSRELRGKIFFVRCPYQRARPIRWDIIVRIIGCEGVRLQ